MVEKYDISVEVEKLKTKIITYEEEKKRLETKLTSSTEDTNALKENLIILTDKIVELQKDKEKLKIEIDEFLQNLSN